MPLSNPFPIKFLKILALSFGWVAKIASIFVMKSPLKVHGLKVRVKLLPDKFQNVKTVEQQGSLISISSESSKNHLLIKALHICGLTSADDFLFRAQNVSLLLAE